MSKFKFRLATPLRVREAARDERRMQLAEVYRLDAMLADRRQSLDVELAGQKSVYGGSLGGELDVDRLLNLHRYELVLRAEIRSIDEQRAAVATEIERRRQALLAAETEVRAMEKLRERQHDRHRQQEALVEMKMLDEVASRAAQKEAPPWADC